MEEKLKNVIKQLGKYQILDKSNGVNFTTTYWDAVYKSIERPNKDNRVMKSYQCQGLSPKFKNCYSKNKHRSKNVKIN